MTPETLRERLAHNDHMQELVYQRIERDRPRPRLEMWQIQKIAKAAATDPTAMLDWAIISPQDFVLAYAAEKYDRDYPTYSCYHCHDGKDLPKGYVCQVCDEENSDRYS